MSVTPADRLARVLPVVISGNRPRLKNRKTARFLPALKNVTADPVWLVRDDRADGYERDGFEIVTFGREAAEAYAAEHWIGDEPYAPGSFLGAFTEREWACRVAEERGCWGVLQLDDNLAWLGCYAGGSATVRVTKRRGGLGFFADILAAVTLATNSAMTGSSLDAVNPRAESGWRFARAGFPYSLFLEQLGPGREPYHGPTEDDILHAYQYGASPGPETAAIVVPLHYRKDHSSKDTGMRVAYRDHKRTVGIQRVAPQMVKLGVRASRSNGRGEARVFHTMTRDAIRTPLAVTDPQMYDAARAALSEVASEIVAEHRVDVAAKVERRAAR